MTYLSITFPEALKRDLDREAKREGTKRSTLIQKSVRLYLELKRQKQTAKLLKEGYRAMSADSRRLSAEFVLFENEALNCLTIPNGVQYPGNSVQFARPQ